MKLLRKIANLGYGSRKQVLALFREGRVRDSNGEVLYSDDAADGVAHSAILIDGQPLDIEQGALLMLHKPLGVTCSREDAGRLIYDLLPPRFALRQPLMAPVGRLDKETTGLLLLTDDGALQHRIIAPKSNIGKVYEVQLQAPLRGDEADIFASGTLLLEAESRPLLPAQMQVLGPQQVRLTLHEGRYHQVRRMFAAVGNHVTALHRSQIGQLQLGDLAPGQWRALDANARALVFAPV